ncbi:hypothetical protein TTRE_0000429901 [Trichuris trichiura]|uniref:Uncharacterized protein n=1 Tax=Trichuris trichiura TaxID=36087 RepID=A0A077ZBN4_TRITR|nr:hypothetical protein TTRE_0000429901 [Trichuris trichiura]
MIKVAFFDRIPHWDITSSLSSATFAAKEAAVDWLVFVLSNKLGGTEKLPSMQMVNRRNSLGADRRQTGADVVPITAL